METVLPVAVMVTLYREGHERQRPETPRSFPSAPGLTSEQGTRPGVRPGSGPGSAPPAVGPGGLFFSLSIGFMSVHPWSPFALRPAVTLDDIKGLTELRKAEPQPSRTFPSGLQGSPHALPTCIPAVLWGR